MSDLKRKLQQLGVSQRELAEHMGVDESYISRLLAPDVMPVPKIRARLLRSAQEIYEVKRVEAEATNRSILQEIVGG